jgi:hypothetical protein
MYPSVKTQFIQYIIVLLKTHTKELVFNRMTVEKPYLILNQSYSGVHNETGISVQVNIDEAIRGHGEDQVF